MDVQITKDALTSLASERETEYTNRLAALDPSNKTETKALKILLNITQICAGFPKMEYAGGDFPAREKMIRDLHVFDGYLSYFDELKGDDRGSFIIFAAAVSMVHYNFFSPAKRAVEENTSAERTFTEKLKYDCTREVLGKWLKWWNENGPVKCEVML
ncbi:MAG: hypothetical protein IKN38_02760 [Clostridia bacterium]|nr:hypothetical protein [Clostridia bacterium]